MKARNFVSGLVALGAVFGGSAASFAAGNAFTPIGTIKLIEAGWSADTVAAYHSSITVTNPAGCAVTGAGYATLDTDPGRALFHTLLLSALLNGKQVKLLVSGTACAFGKPRIIAVDIYP